MTDDENAEMIDVWWRSNGGGAMRAAGNALQGRGEGRVSACVDGQEGRSKPKTTPAA